MDLKTLKRCTLMVPMNGGELVAHTVDGEILWSVGLTPGIHEGKRFVPYLSADDVVEFSDGVSVMVPEGRVTRMTYGDGSHHVGANPDFRPSAADRHVRALENSIRKINARMDRAEKRRETQERLKAEEPPKAVEADEPKAVSPPPDGEPPATPPEDDAQKS